MTGSLSAMVVDDYRAKGKIQISDEKNILSRILFSH